MKAEMDINGTLVITPETPIESYALKHWSDNFVFPEKNMEGQSMLLIKSAFNDRKAAAKPAKKGGKK